MGALSRNLHELQGQGNYLSIYDEPNLPSQVFYCIIFCSFIQFDCLVLIFLVFSYTWSVLYMQDPVINSINAAINRLSSSTNFLNFMAKHAMIIQEDLPSPLEEHVVDDERYNFMSLMLNLVNTFLYMVNTYIIVPTADDYSTNLGAAATVCGVVIGAMAIAQVFSSVYFSAWSNKSYFKPLVFSSIVLFLGNTLYALAYDLNSLWVLLFGRLLCG